MIKEVKYNGLSAVPSDYDCTDGDLAISMNLINEDGALRPIQPPCEVLTCPDVYIPIATHSVANGSNYILHNAANGNIIALPSSWTSSDSLPSPFLTLDTGVTYASTTIVGNTLVILASDGMHYCLWRDSSYKHLGTSIPYIPLTIQLEGHEVVYGGETLHLAEAIEHIGALSNDNKNAVTDAIMGMVNKFVAEYTKKGWFIFPFYVRYALRLYDGSYTRQSAPILMQPVIGYNPHITAPYAVGEGKKDLPYTVVNAVVTTLCVSITGSAQESAPIKSLLQTWSDIIQSIDIFVSAPIFDYDQSGSVSSVGMEPSRSQQYVTCQYDNKGNLSDSLGARNNLFTLSDYFPGSPYTFDLPRFSAQDMRAKYENAVNFYLLRRILPEEFSSIYVRTTDLAEDYLTSLTSKELLPDDYDSNDTLVPRFATAYNNRLTIANISKSIFPGNDPRVIVPVLNRGTTYYNVSAYVYFNYNGKSFVLKSDECSAGDMTQILFVYHPSPYAVKMVFARRVSSGSGNSYTQYFECPLARHPLLNGSYWLSDSPTSGLMSWSTIASDTLPTTIDDMAHIDIPNKIYNSDVNNPFSFPLTGISTIGTGDILGISSAARPLSQGQFGQFPLYAFTTDGVWALEISSSGSFIARQPITRDVCINSNAITQLDNVVLFPTERGIMQIAGSQTQCITDIISSKYPFDCLGLLKKSKFNKCLEHNPENDDCLPILSFSEFLLQCRMIYDYVHQRIIVYAKGVAYAYVFSLKSQSWGMMHSDFSSNLNSYPDALAFTSEGKIVNLAASATDNVNCWLLSRPLHLDTPNIHKTVNSVIQRGFFRNAHIQSVLFASRDLFSWHLIWSSKNRFMRGIHGSPYKYFRIALVCDLAPDECISGCSVAYDTKLTNQQR